MSVFNPQGASNLTCASSFVKKNSKLLQHYNDFCLKFMFLGCLKDNIFDIFVAFGV